MKKRYTRMTAKELEDATKEFDRPGATDSFKPLSQAERKKWTKAVKKRGRPRKDPEEKSVRVLISIRPELLLAAHRLARQTGNTLSGLIADQLEGALPKKRRSA
jgi:hypothetical protein